MTTIALGVRRTKVRFALDLYQGRQTMATEKTILQHSYRRFYGCV